MFWRLLMESFRRQRRRKALAGVAILLGTTAVTAMLALATTIGDRIHRELAVYGANIVVTPAAAGLDVNIGGVEIKPATGGAYLHEADLEKLKTIFWANNITGVSPEYRISGMMALVRADWPEGKTTRAFWRGDGAKVLPDGTPVDAVGYWFDHPFGLITTGAPQLHPWWHLQGRWPVEHNISDPQWEGANEIIVGSELARHFDLHIGDWVNMTVETGGKIVGIVTSGDRTDQEILYPLDSFGQGVLPINPDGSFRPAQIDLTRVDISARTKPEDAFARKDPDKLSPKDHEIWYCRPYANSIAYQIQEAIPGSRAEQVRRVEQSEGTVLERISGLMWLISAAALLAAGFAVSAAMATAILERRAEIGLMRSLGAAKPAIAMLLFAETGLLAVFAGALGYLLGSGLAAWLGAHIFSGDGTGVSGATSVGATILAAFNPVLLPVVVGLALIVAIAGSTPAIRAALRLDPAAILRSDA